MKFYLLFILEVIMSYNVELIEKIDEIFGFNLNNNIDKVDYNFWQYKLNQLYKPLVKYFVYEFSKFLDGKNSNEATQIISLFIDFFKLYYFQWDFWYFKSKYSSFNYKIPYGIWYLGKDTEFWRASKDCYYVKTSDVISNIDIRVPTQDLSLKQIRLQFFKESKQIQEGNKVSMELTIEPINDEESQELLWYNIYILNFAEDDTSKLLKEKAIIEKIQNFWIQVTPGVKKILSEFLSKWWRDFFVHKRLKDFLRWELEWYLFQVLKWDIQWRIDILSIENKISELKEKYSWDRDYIEYQIAKIYAENTKDLKTNLYQDAYVWIYNFINILSDLENFKVSLWNKKRKIIKQEYCISLWKIENYEGDISLKNQIFWEILDNEVQLKIWEQDISKEKYLDKISIDVIKKELSSWKINLIKNLVVETNYFCKNSKLYEILSSRWVKKLYDSDSILDWIMIKSENYQGLKILTDDYREKIQGIYIDPPFNLGENWNFLYKTDYLDGSRCSLLVDRYSEVHKLMMDSWSIFTRCDINWDDLIRHICSLIFSDGYLLSKITLRKLNQQWENIKQFNPSTDSLFHYWKSWIIKFNHQYKDRQKAQNWIPMHSPRQNKSEQTIDIWWRIFIAPFGRHRTFSQSRIPNMIKEWRIKINESVVYTDVYWNFQKGMPFYLTSGKEILDSNRSDISWYSNTTGFKTENSEILLQRCIQSVTDKKDIFMDYFSGSATTQAVAQKLWRKRIGIELWEQFEQYDLPRLKSVLQGKKSWISGQKEVDYQWWGFFTYLYLNQYEDRFSMNGYLTRLEDDIVELRDLAIDENTRISQILFLLNELKNRIYSIDDQLSNVELQSMSRMLYR